MTLERLLWKPKSDPPSPYRTSKRVGTCTKTQGSSLQSPEDNGVAEGVTGRTLRDGVLPRGS